MKDIKQAGLNDNLKQLLISVDELPAKSGGRICWSKGSYNPGGPPGSVTIVSIAFGNQGWVCTWTNECMNNCR